MFQNIGIPELIIILIIALIIFGPKKLPDIGRAIGKALQEFKKGSKEIKDELTKDELTKEELTKEEEEEKRG